MQKISLPLPDDFHAHLRQGDAMPEYVRDLAMQFGRALIMPNTIPAMTTAQAIAEYKTQILAAAKPIRENFTALMTFKLNPHYTEDDLRAIQKAGAIAGKYYPAGVTTNSSDGISDFEAVFPVFALMEKLGLVLCVHGEEPGEFCLEREPAFIRRVEILAKTFPRLKIVFEHLSSAVAVEAVLKMPENVAATFTIHHLMMTLDDIVGDTLRPHHFCKPLPKRPTDRETIRKAAFSGNPKFFLGTDSAPHKMENKECPCGAAGVYSAPVALPLLTQIFEEGNALEKLPDFIAGFGADFYNIPRTKETISLIKEDWTVPTIMHGVVPLAAGETLHWKLSN